MYVIILIDYVLMWYVTPGPYSCVWSLYINIRYESCYH